MPLNTGQDTMTEAYRLLQEVAPVDWATYFETAGKAKTHELVKDLAAIAERAARAADYLDERSFDTSHEKAVQRQNMTGAAVRRALGYQRFDISF